MKVTKRIVWTTDEGRELLVKEDENSFRVVPSITNAETLRELAAACYDATKATEEVKP